MAEERLQKILARAGIASRRAAEQMMLEGRVVVNGQVANEPGMKADPERDHIRVDGKMILNPQGGPRLYYLAFKPREMITSLSDPEGRPTIVDLLKRRGIKARVYPVGRLDWDADGLLILTNDGDLANLVMHPKMHLPKLYRVKVKGAPGPRELDKVRRGVTIEPGIRTLPAEVVVEETSEESTWLRVTLVEGRQNQIKRMFERVGHPVRRIRRLAIGPLRLGRMRVGDVRPMTPAEQDKLRRALAGAPAPLPARRPFDRRARVDDADRPSRRPRGAKGRSSRRRPS